METYLDLFEEAVKRQAELVGEETAYQQAKKAGLGVSAEGHIVSCTGNPQLVLLRLIKCFTAGGNMRALTQCVPLINEVLKSQGEGSEGSEELEALRELAD